MKKSNNFYFGSMQFVSARGEISRVQIWVVDRDKNKEVKNTRRTFFGPETTQNYVDYMEKKYNINPVQKHFVNDLFILLPF